MEGVVFEHITMHNTFTEGASEYIYIFINFEMAHKIHNHGFDIYINILNHPKVIRVFPLGE